MGVYIELPKEWAKWSFDVRDIHDNILVAKVTDLDLVRCEECEWSNGECSVGERYQGGCTFGERRADDKTEESRP